MRAVLEALRGTKHFTGEYRLLLSLEEICGADLRLTSAFISHALHGSSFLASSALRAVRYLHVVLELQREDGRFAAIDMGTEYLIVDMFSARRHLDETFHVELASLLRIPTLKRLLVRPRLYNVENIPSFLKILDEWAHATRDARVWLDDTPWAD
ncbi:hypothetical protein EXIGLDRAFT_775998, partial [Exidia glandulosa HHB12029]